jgi:hypothetical protein
MMSHGKFIENSSSKNGGILNKYIMRIEMNTFSNMLEVEELVELVG